VKPWEEGWLAGLAGDDPRVCPYPAMTREWCDWQKFHGWAVTLLR
jgi:ribosome modulation factor